uniref:Protein inhibitor of activated STAT, 4a n=1 Tax=Lates calcarifer TaxID=8187 RepID=A0A4W6CYF1_LATCA
MVKSFRVSDLQTLLASMGRSKSGLKQDLVGRALRLVQTEYSPELLKNVRQLYESRFPKTSGWLAARRPEGVPVAYSPLSHSPTATSQGADYLNGISKPIPTPAAEVKLVPLPFYQTLETLLSPTELIAQNNEKLQDSQCIFELTPNQADQIRNASELRPGIRSIQVVLRICYTDSIGVQEDQYPPNIAVKVNQSYCHVPGYYPSNKPGVEPRRPCRPVNITPWLHLSSVTNRVTVTWGNFGKRYSVAVYLVRVFTAADLFSQLKLCSVESAERCRERIQDKLRFDPESEIATTGLRVSLICPVTMTFDILNMVCPLPLPFLSCFNLCHLQCFDAVFFLQMNEKKPTWTCPVCDKPAPFELLTIDGLLSEILKETSEDIEEIEYLTDGSWRPIRDDKERDRERERSNTPEYLLLIYVSANGHSPAHSSTSLTGKSGSSSGDGRSHRRTCCGTGRRRSALTVLPEEGRYNYDKDLVTAY